MSDSLKKWKKLYNEFRISFLKSSPLYRFSLDKRGYMLNPERFINDPWSGDAIVGRNILNGIFVIRDREKSIDIIKALKSDDSLSISDIEYINSFVWIRDLQAIGGNNSRKYVRNVISEFIDLNHSIKMFWMLPSWNIKIIADRIVNWMMSFHFFASGSDDKFQRDVLCSIQEQFSHINKTYQIEDDPFTKLNALKSLFFCLCSMKGNHRRSIKGILSRIHDVIDESIDNFGMIINKNPNDQFNMLRSLLEIRFMARSCDIEIDNDFFYRKLSEMASCVRFLRLGDGKLSGHSGNFLSSGFFIPRSHIIDTALSLVDIQYFNENNNKIRGFERISTKKVSIILNTEIFNRRSHFNPIREPGLNIFDFEVSFMMDRLINRADISIVYNDRYRLKPSSSSNVFFTKKIIQDGVCFEGEMKNFNDAIQFAIRREIVINKNLPKINVSEFCLCSRKCDVYYRIVLNKDAVVEKINNSSVLINNYKNEYLFNIVSSSINQRDIIVHNKDEETIYPSIIIFIKDMQGDEMQIDWSIELLNKL